MAIADTNAEGRKTRSPESAAEFVLTPEKISELTGKPLAEVKADLRNTQERGIMAHKLSLLQEVRASPYGGDVEKLERHLGLVQQTLESKQSWLGKGWEKVKSVLRNKWVKRGLIVAAIAAAAYLGIKYMPSWDQIMAWMQRLRAVKAAQASSSAIQATPLASPPLVEALVTPPRPFSAGVPDATLQVPTSTAADAARAMGGGTVGGTPVEEVIKSLPGNLPRGNLHEILPNPKRMDR